MSAALPKKIIAYLRLTRPANLLTAIADILAGVSAAGIIIASASNLQSGAFHPVFWLMLATIGLYGGGVVFNDAFDAPLDRKERPDRPIPRGLATVRGAAGLGVLLFAVGIFSASRVSALSGCIAVAITALALAYDAKLKHYVFWGPLIMGLCRAGNLLLGMSLSAQALQGLWFMGLVPLTFIAAVTLVSRGEVHGGNKKNLLAAAGLFIAVIAALISYSLIPEFNLPAAIPFIALFALLIFFPLTKAIQKPSAKNIGLSVQFGVLSLTVMDASLAAGFTGWQSGLFVLALLPLSMALARVFSVT